MKEYSFLIKPAACIFDVDDTLISNYYPDGTGMHDAARFKALQVIGTKYKLPALQSTTLEENHSVVHRAPQHTIESITWTLLYEKGVVKQPDVVPGHALLEEIIALKGQYYMENILRDGKEIPGASHYLHHLKEQGVKRAIASGASLRDIHNDLHIIGAEDIFAPHHIIHKESYTLAKPYPDPFLAAMAALELTAEEVTDTWAFEDEIKGVQSAHAAGLKVCIIASRFSADELAKHAVPQDIIVRNFLEILPK